MVKFLTNIGGTIRDFSAKDIYEFKQNFEDWHKNIYLPVISAGASILGKDTKNSEDIDVSKGFFYRDKKITDAIFFSSNKLDKNQKVWKKYILMILTNCKKHYFLNFFLQVVLLITPVFRLCNP